MELQDSHASLRIFGKVLDFGGISQKLGREPSGTHRVGDLDLLKKPYREDAWFLDSPLGKQATLDAHLKWFHETLSPHYGFLRFLQAQGNRVDFYLGYSSYTDQAGFEISFEALAPLSS